MGGSVTEGVGFWGDPDTMFAYYAALRRVLDILRGGQA